MRVTSPQNKPHQTGDLHNLIKNSGSPSQHRCREQTQQMATNTHTHTTSNVRATLAIIQSRKTKRKGKTAYRKCRKPLQTIQRTHRTRTSNTRNHTDLACTVGGVSRITCNSDGDTTFILPPPDGPRWGTRSSTQLQNISLHPVRLAAAIRLGDQHHVGMRFGHPELAELQHSSLLRSCTR